jgi:hypothetical protein
MYFGFSLFPNAVFAAKVVHFLLIDLKQACRSNLAAIGTAERCRQISDLNLRDLFVKTDSSLGYQHGFLAGGAVVKEALRQVLDLDDRAVYHEHEALHEILQFAHIAGPAILFQNVHYLRIQSFQGYVVRAAVEAEEMV